MAKPAVYALTDPAAVLPFYAVLLSAILTAKHTLSSHAVVHYTETITVLEIAAVPGCICFP